MNPIFGLLTQLFVSKGLKRLDDNDSRREHGKTLWTDEQKKQLAEYERQDRRETWSMALTAAIVLGIWFFWAYWLNRP